MSIPKGPAGYRRAAGTQEKSRVWGRGYLDRGLLSAGSRAGEGYARPPTGRPVGSSTEDIKRLLLAKGGTDADITTALCGLLLGDVSAPSPFGAGALGWG